MENVIILAILAVVIVFALRASIRHFRGEGGCCGGGDYKPKKKRLPRVLYQKTFQVEGMHCDHCKARVEEAVNDIPGVAGRVNLKKGELTVSYAEDVADDLILRKIQRAGYTAKKSE